MAFIDSEIRNLIFAMNNNASFFTSKVIKMYSREEIKALIRKIKFELVTTIMNDDDADELFLLKLSLENALN